MIPEYTLSCSCLGCDDEIASRGVTPKALSRQKECTSERRRETDGSSSNTMGPHIVVLFFPLPADSTGTHSLYTAYKDYELMFHVSTMLPYTPNNKQQVRSQLGPRPEDHRGEYHIHIILGNEENNLDDIIGFVMSER